MLSVDNPWMKTLPQMASGIFNKPEDKLTEIDLDAARQWMTYLMVTDPRCFPRA